MNTAIEVNKPAPSVPGKKIESFKRGSDIKHAINVLEAGNPILITEFFSNGLSLLSELKTHLNDKLVNYIVMVCCLSKVTLLGILSILQLLCLFSRST